MPFVDSKQLLILKYLTTHLEGITGIDVQDRDANGEPVVNGSGDPVLTQVTLADRVFRGRMLFGEEMGFLPFLSILEGKRPDQLPDYAGYDKLLRSEAWHLLIQGFMEDNADNPLDNMYRLKAMTEQRLAMLVEVTSSQSAFPDSPTYPDVYLMGGLIMDLSIGPGIVRPSNPTQGGTEAFFLPIALTFAMNVADPFSVA